MKNFKVLVSERAVNDVVRNTHWWAANHSREEAVKWRSAIFKRIFSLEVMPKSNPIACENPDFPYELREARFGLSSRPGYRILFTVIEDRVNVLTVKATEENWVSPEDLD